MSLTAIHYQTIMFQNKGHGQSHNVIYPITIQMYSCISCVYILSKICMQNMKFVSYSQKFWQMKINSFLAQRKQSVRHACSHRKAGQKAYDQERL